MKRTTRRKDPSKALKVAMDFERLDKKASEERLVESQVESVVADIVQGITGKKMRHFTVRQWFTQWLAIKEAKSEGTFRRYQATVNGFLRHLGQPSHVLHALVAALADGCDLRFVQGASEALTQLDKGGALRLPW